MPLIFKLPVSLRSLASTQITPVPVSDEEFPYGTVVSLRFFTSFVIASFQHVNGILMLVGMLFSIKTVNRLGFIDALRDD